MKYAPIMIPTCNRYEHLKRCLDSLASNTLAKETDIFLSVDYPPQKEYFLGYEKIVDFLKRFDKNKFNKFEIIIQKENLGPKKNCKFLYDLLKKDYDRFIFSEDDNEFSPNFLLYINKCFEENELDPRLFTICGFKSDSKSFFYNEKFSGTVYKTYYTQPYGYACLFSKFEEFYRNNYIILDKKNYSIRNIRRLYNYNPYLAYLFVDYILCRKDNLFFDEDERLAPIDGVMQLYSYYSGLYSIFPVINKSRTRGIDGSGVTMGKDDTIDIEKDWVLDRSSSFVYKECSDEDVNSELAESKDRYKKKKIKRYLKCLIKLHIFYLGGCDGKRARKVIAKLNKIRI